MTANEELQRLRYENALRWITTVAMMHYFGGAFEPEHMRSIGNIAAGALSGRDLPDHELSMVKARKKARKLYESFREVLEEDNREDGEPRDL